MMSRTADAAAKANQISIGTAFPKVVNVRHEQRAKGREAAFGTSARWRG
jgi:hypothetical protein